VVSEAFVKVMKPGFVWLIGCTGLCVGEKMDFCRRVVGETMTQELRSEGIGGGFLLVKVWLTFAFLLA
jgi:hypothetical protein